MASASTHAFGGFADTLRALKPRVATGGLILVGDLFWWKPPAAAYREVIGDEGFPPADTIYATGAQIGQDEGLTLLYATASSPDEWDHFEGGRDTMGFGFYVFLKPHLGMA